MVEEEVMEHRYEVTPVEGHPGWSVTQVNNDPPEMSGPRSGRIQEFDVVDEYFQIEVDAPYEGCVRGNVPIAAVVTIMRAMGYTITPPST